MITSRPRERQDRPHNLERSADARSVQYTSYQYSTSEDLSLRISTTCPSALQSRAIRRSLCTIPAVGVGEAHFVVVPSSAKVVPATVTADDLVDPSLHEVFREHTAKNGSFAVRASERSAHVINSLACGEAYDVFFVTEV